MQKLRSLWSLRIPLVSHTHLGIVDKQSGRFGFKEASQFARAKAGNSKGLG